MRKFVCPKCGNKNESLAIEATCQGALSKDDKKYHAPVYMKEQKPLGSRGSDDKTSHE